MEPTTEVQVVDQGVVDQLVDQVVVEEVKEVEAKADIETKIEEVKEVETKVEAETNADIETKIEEVKEVETNAETKPREVDPLESDTSRCYLDEKEQLLIYKCPHCSLQTTTFIAELACCIFRHGFNKKTNTQLSPHESKEQCDRLAQDPDIVGCCKPFKIAMNDQKEYHVYICDYI
jgi:hypothetical protein